MSGQRDGDDSLKKRPLPLSPPSPTRPSASVSLEFGGVSLALPDVDDDPQEQANPSDASASSVDHGVNDGWSRLRESEAPPPISRPISVAPPSADAIELVTKRSRPPSLRPEPDLAAEMHDRYALGDYSGALRVAQLVLGREPQHEKAQDCAVRSRERLEQLYEARLGSICGTEAANLGVRVPVLAVPDHEIRWLGLDHRQGFLLSRIDGQVSVDDLVDLTGMSRLDVLRCLVEMVELRAIEFG
jgi:hypothetical protein